MSDSLRKYVLAGRGNGWAQLQAGCAPVLQWWQGPEWLTVPMRPQRRSR